MIRSLCTVALAATIVFSLTGTASAQSQFLRGDSNFDGDVTILDALFTLNWVFVGGDAPACEDAADYNDNGVINLIDPLNTLQFLFAGGAAPAAPYPTFELDPTDADGINCKPEIVIHTGDITEDETWANDVTHVIESGVFVRDGATVTIEAGTTVIGDSETQGLLVIDRGAALEAIGENARPIVFTSENAAGSRARGDWGGLIMLGNASNNLPGGEGEAEGLQGELFGGGATPNDADDSGQLSYVRIEYGGTEISTDNEVNGLSMFSVGSETEFDHLQVKYNADDGYEWFGGTCNLKYALAIGIGDDSFDYSFGWTGYGQFWVAQQRADDADQGFEADNSEADFSALPLTMPTISNFSLFGDPDTDDGTESDIGMLLRRGVGGLLYNGIIAGFKDAGADIDNLETATHNPTNGEAEGDYLTFQNDLNFLVDADEVTFAYNTEDWFTIENSNNTEALATDEIALDPYNIDAPDFRPGADLPTTFFDNTTLPAFFDVADYQGALEPGVSVENDWTQQPWVSYARD